MLVLLESTLMRLYRERLEIRLSVKAGLRSSFVAEAPRSSKGYTKITGKDETTAFESVSLVA